MPGVLLAIPHAPAQPRPLGGGLPWRWRGPGLSRRQITAAAVVALVLAAGTTATAVTVAQAPSKPPVVACSTGGVTLTAEQLRNAATIVATGKAAGVPARGQVVALATALQESTLHNYPGGDRDSAGLFQQRPSQGWGSWAQVTDPVYAARTFYRHLLAIPGWAALPVTVAAQTVQRSAFPDAYAKWQPLAEHLVSGTTCVKK